MTARARVRGGDPRPVGSGGGDLPRGRRAGSPGRGLLLVCSAGMVWGSIGTAVQLIHDRSSLSALSMGAYRALAAVATLLIASVLTGRLRACFAVACRQWKRVVAVGVATASFQLLFFVAVVISGVSVATVVCLGFAPVLLLAVTSVQRRRLPSVGQAVTVTMALLGLVLVGSVGGHSSHATLGILAALGSGASYALSAHVGAPLSQRLDTLTITTATMSVVAAVLVPVGLLVPYLLGEPLATTDVGSWALLAYLGVVTMAIAYALLFAGLRSTPSGAAVVATLLEPVTAVLLADVVLGERLTRGGLVGSLLILAAIGTLGWQSDEPQPQ